MKKNDLTLIIVITTIAVVIAVFIGNGFITSPKNRSQTVEDVKRFDTNFPLPDARVFNAQALDPTRDITIGPSTNNQPFTNKGK